jgi:hypothetical protein
LSVPFPFRWYSGGCIFFSCWLRFDVALCYRGLSPCALICNLWVQVSHNVLIACSTYVCIYCKIQWYVLFTDFSGLGAVGYVFSGGRLCLGVAFTSGGSESLHSNGLCFGRLVTMSSSVFYGELRELRFRILLWV